MWRKVGVLSLCLSVLQGILDLTDRDGTVGTAAEIAMLGAVFGGRSPQGRAGAKTGDADGQDEAAALLKALEQ